MSKEVEAMNTMVPVGAGRPSVQRQATLRPHTLMLDLLLQTVMLFALLMGLVARPAVVDTRDVSTPGQAEAAEPLLFHSVRGPSGLAYRQDGQSKLLSAQEVAALVRARGVRLALVADPRAPLDAFLAIEQPLRSVGLDVALAVDATTRRTP
jgi:hypothetical protein